MSLAGRVVNKSSSLLAKLLGSFQIKWFNTDGKGLILVKRHDILRILGHEVM